MSSRKCVFLKNKDWFVHPMWKAECSCRKDKGCGVRPTWAESWFFCSLAVWLWTGYSGSLSFSVLFWKIGIKILLHRIVGKIKWHKQSTYCRCSASSPPQNKQWKYWVVSSSLRAGSGIGLRVWILALPTTNVVLGKLLNFCLSVSSFLTGPIVWWLSQSPTPTVSPSANVLIILEFTL